MTSEGIPDLAPRRSSSPRWEERVRERRRGWGRFTLPDSGTRGRRKKRGLLCSSTTCLSGCPRRSVGWLNPIGTSSAPRASKPIPHVTAAAKATSAPLTSPQNHRRSRIGLHRGNQEGHVLGDELHSSRGTRRPRRHRSSSNMGKEGDVAVFFGLLERERPR